MKLLMAVLCAAVLAGCANPYAQFYHEQVDPKSMPSYVPTTEPLKVYSTNDFPKDIDQMVRKGYSKIGYSSFNGASNNVTEDQLRTQATKLGAAAVLVSSHYTHTLSGAIPLTLPSTTTSYTNGTATVYGRNGAFNANVSATTTTYGTETTMIPYQVQRSDFEAAYFVRIRQRAGMIVVPMDDAAHKRLGSNSGLMVHLVVEGTPAFNADIFAGDVLVAVNEERVSSLEQYKHVLDTYEGQTATFHVNRDGQLIDKTFRIISYKDPI